MPWNSPGAVVAPAGQRPLSINSNHRPAAHDVGWRRLHFGVDDIVELHNAASRIAIVRRVELEPEGGVVAIGHVDIL